MKTVFLPRGVPGGSIKHQSFNHQQSTINHQTSNTNHHTPIINRQPPTIKHQPSAPTISIKHQSPTINHQSTTMSKQPSIINQKPSNINQRPSTINDQSPTINQQQCGVFDVSGCVSQMVYDTPAAATYDKHHTIEGGRGGRPPSQVHRIAVKNNHSRSKNKMWWAVCVLLRHFNVILFTCTAVKNNHLRFIEKIKCGGLAV